MKAKNRSRSVKNHRGLGFWFFVIGLLFCALLLLVIKFTGLDHHQNQTRDSKPRVDSDSAMTHFSQNTLVPILEELKGGKTDYLKINARYQDLHSRILQAFGRFSVMILVDYNTPIGPAPKGTEASSVYYKDGKDDGAKIWFFPAIFDYYNFLKRSGNPRWYEVFRSHVIIVVLHEMEHLGRARQKTNRAANILGVNIEEEIRTWAETCEYDVRPLVEKYGVELGNTESVLYEAWIKSSRNANSDSWKSAVSQKYTLVAPQ